MPKVEASGSSTRQQRASLIADPRRPTEARRYEKPQIDPEQIQDPMLFFGLVFGMIALVMKWKFAAWVAVFSTAAAFANMRTDNMDIKQLVSSTTFAVMGLVATYIVPVATRGQR